MRKIRWGVLGVAGIATRKVIPAMQRGQQCEVVAIASRDADRAGRAAAALGLPRAYGSYEALLDDADIDAVYNPLPNHLHVPWTTRAAERGKHVLCEKPIAPTAAEARQLLDVRERTGVKIQEAFMVRAHPQWQTARALAHAGRIGELRAMTGIFSYHNVDPANIRNVPAFGGGALLDIGCYLVNTARYIFGGEPQRVAAAIDRDPQMGTDRLTSMLLDFGGRHLIGTCSTQMVPTQRVQILGTRGRIEIPIPFNAPPDRPCELIVDSGADLFGASQERIELPVCDQYTLQGDLFAKAILEDTEVPEPLEDAVQNMLILEEIMKVAIPHPSSLIPNR